MTAIAGRAVLAQMPIVLAMTGAALLRHLGRSRRFVVTVGALQLRVRAEQRKVGLLRMIEHPLRPAVRRVTALALFAESALVDIVMGMAVDAVRRRLRERERGMALRTARHAVQSEQREMREVMVEDDVAGPGFLAMAAIAAAREPAAVRILAAMTADAVEGELLLGCDSGMADVTLDAGVRAHERELVPSGVVVARHAPALVIMAVFAFGPETPGVRVIRRMATVAVLGNLVLVAAAAVTGEAIQIRVHAEQGVARFPKVVELRRLPFLGDVAFGTVLPARPAVRIVRRVAPDAGLGRRLVAAADMTGVAAQTRMRAREPEFCSIVIEAAAGPGHRTVAVATRLGELAAMDVVCLVAGGAARGRFAPCGPGRVAGGAAERCMSAFERKIREPVVELGPAEPDDVGVASLVFRVTGAAFAAARIRHAAVKSQPLPQIRGDVLVAAHAQCRLGARIGAVVTVRAGFLELFVRARHFSRHQQRFDRRGRS